MGRSRNKNKDRWLFQHEKIYNAALEQVESLASTQKQLSAACFENNNLAQKICKLEEKLHQKEKELKKSDKSRLYLIQELNLIFSEIRDRKFLTKEAIEENEGFTYLRKLNSAFNEDKKQLLLHE